MEAPCDYFLRDSSHTAPKRVESVSGQESRVQNPVVGRQQQRDIKHFFHHILEDIILRDIIICALQNRIPYYIFFKPAQVLLAAKYAST